MNKVTIAVQAGAPIVTISPRLYGHFAEHLGRCCYGGLWVGADCEDTAASDWRIALPAHSIVGFVLITKNF